MGLEHSYQGYRETGSPPSGAAKGLCGRALPGFTLSVCSLPCLHVRIGGPQARPQLSVSQTPQGRSQVLLLQHKRVLVDQLPRDSCWAMGDRGALSDLTLLCLFSCEPSDVPPRALLCCFPWRFSYQDAVGSVSGPPVLVADVVMGFALLPVARVLPGTGNSCAVFRLAVWCTGQGCRPGHGGDSRARRPHCPRAVPAPRGAGSLWPHGDNRM